MTTGADDRNRVGTFATLAQAMASGMLRAATGVESPAYIVEATGMSGGRVVAGWHAEFGWVELDVDESAPEWWDKLDQHSQGWLIKNPQASLPASMVEAVTTAGATATSAYWAASEAGRAPFYLAASVQDWLLRRGLLDEF